MTDWDAFYFIIIEGRHSMHGIVRRIAGRSVCTFVRSGQLLGLFWKCLRHHVRTSVHLVVNIAIISHRSAILFINRNLTLLCLA